MEVYTIAYMYFNTVCKYWVRTQWFKSYWNLILSILSIFFPDATQAYTELQHFLWKNLLKPISHCRLQMFKDHSYSWLTISFEKRLSFIYLRFEAFISNSRRLSLDLSDHTIFRDFNWFQEVSAEQELLQCLLCSPLMFLSPDRLPVCLPRACRCLPNCFQLLRAAERWTSAPRCPPWTNLLSFNSPFFFFSPSPIFLFFPPPLQFL